MQSSGIRQVAKSHGEAVRWYRKAAEQGLDLGQYALGVAYWSGQGVSRDDREAVGWFRKAADQGMALAQNNLGVSYAEGRGVTLDYGEAVKWYRQAAGQGLPIAQANLGAMYLKGQGVIQDYREAARWFMMAAERGDANAINNLGLLHENGVGGYAKDTVAAYALYNLAASLTKSEGRSGATDSMRDNRDRSVKTMSLQDIETAQALTRELQQPGNFAKALAARQKTLATEAKTSTMTRKPPARQTDGRKTDEDASAANDPYPPRPAKTPGRISCNTRCVNAQCWRTYDDGRKVKFNAKQKWNSFENRFAWDAGPC